MSAISNKEILRVINETLGTETTKTAKPHTLNESYVLQPKSYEIRTDILSQKSVSANIKDFEETVKICNQVSAQLDSADRSVANPKETTFRDLKMAEGYNLCDAFLTSTHLDNIADPNSKVVMDSLAYLRLSRDFGTFENWQKDFIACALSARDGFVVTVFNGSLNRYMNVIEDDSSNFSMYNCYPVICLCVKERWYFRDYLNDRRSYVYAMMKELNWGLIEERFKRADKLAKLLSSPLGG